MIKEKQPLIKRFFRSKAVIVFEVLILVVISSALAKEVVRRYQIQGEIRELQAEAEQLEQKKVELEDFIAYFSGDDYKEEQARLKLGLQKPGESVITVLGESTDISQGVEEVGVIGQEEENISNPQQWWNYFNNIKKER